MTAAAKSTASLSDRVARGAAWIVGGRLLVRSLGLINTLILARLLVPEDFGLVAIGVTVMQLLQNITDIGVSRTVVKFRNATRKQYDTLFTISLIRGAVVTGVMLLAAVLADNFYDDPRATFVFFGIAIVPMLHALANPRFFEFERNLDFSKHFWVGAADKLIGVAVSIVIAVIFRTYWAIILGLVAGTFVQSMLSWVLRPYRPRFSLASIREVGGFTGWLAGISFVAALNNKLDVLVLGKFVSPADLGAFFVGGSIASLPSDEIAVPIARAAYPGFSELQGDPAAMRSAYLGAAEALAFIAMPAAFGVAFTAPDLVTLLLGEGWDRAALMLQYFAPAAGLAVVFYATNAYAFALGKARTVFMREIVVFLIRMPIFVAAAYYFGLVGAAVACGFGRLLVTALNAGLYARLSGGAAYEPLLRARRPLAGVAAMSVYFLLVRDVLPLEAWPVVARLGTDVMIGAGVYLLSVFGLWRMSGAADGFERLLIGKTGAFLSLIKGYRVITS